jgi:prophage maintenance system killer protein
MKNKPTKDITIYQAKNGAIEFRGDFKQETIWGTQKQIAEVFDVDRSVVTKHIKNIFKDKELDKTVVSAKFAHTTQHGAIQGKTQTKTVELYNLDIILAVGYRTNSARAIEFRKWATKTLKQHLLYGYTINKKRIGQHYEKFMQAVADVKALLPAGNTVKTEDILELIGAFANTWFSLDAYDKSSFPQKGVSKKQVKVTAEELAEALQELKQDLIKKKEATDIFGQERSNDGVAGIVGNVFQSVYGKDAYPTGEEKAAHLLYFMVKNHPFTDGNKRSGAFAFIWFLRKAGLLRASFTPEALTAITLLVAESNPKDKEKMTGLIVLLITGKYE